MLLFSTPNTPAMTPAGGGIHFIFSHCEGPIPSPPEQLAWGREMPGELFLGLPTPLPTQGISWREVVFRCIVGSSLSKDPFLSGLSVGPPGYLSPLWAESRSAGGS